MKIDKSQFHHAVLQMKEHPHNHAVQQAYVDQITRLAATITKTYRIFDQPLEDSIQDLIEYSFHKRLHDRIDKEKSAFSYFWRSLSGYAWHSAKERHKKNHVYIADLQDNQYTDGRQGEEQMFRRLGFSLDDYVSNTPDTYLEEVETVEVTKGKRGRPKVKADGEKAAHWEYLFSTLRRKKTMTETQLVKQLPPDKQKDLKNPGKSVEYYMRQISKRESVTLSISDNGKDTVYMVIGD